ncbi:hypothetical protein ACS0TY_035655 [Phlomoides rotata]
MADSSGTSSQIQNSGSEMEQRKRKRMESNRESARRSRMKKQKHLDDLKAQVYQISEKNKQISSSINVSTQQYVKVDAENSILRAQMTELSQRLQSLNEILNFINSAADGGGSSVVEAEEFLQQGSGDCFLNVNNSWNLMGAANQHPIMASAEIFDYY